MKHEAKIFKALSDPTRLRIVALLLEGELCVCDLMAVLGLPQSTVSRHLANLRHAGLVEDERRGVWMFYRLASSPCPLQQDVVRLFERQFPQRTWVIEDRERLREVKKQKDSPSC
ncbi:MAG TPA: ArsR family transcriptional regulator [Geoalkalibacter subterraneus]|uniref:ArsR family transcriptional regulator n=1 Tax=Geoalkalibacter subterraneus TaxID=483547 RepID=A0A831PK06_9BACT|nr:ArsR family transcriptional regulator [Geoalkalibacter subterraneus]